MFDVTVKYLGFLKHLPLLPHLFDALIRIQTLFMDRNVLTYMDEIEHAVLSWENTYARVHRFGGIQFDVNGQEIGHIHSNGLLDILFHRKIKSVILKDGRAKDHHVFKNSGWISFRIKNEEDKKYALRLLRESYLLKTQRSML